ncbi:unnamed protein product [Clavelina lepadiformis]|uniref:Carrier domain-containing protein n=1 Tax=Clavelina lepadiformis TaxID=159417 RepID=A0ABP0FXR3_CLALP
MKSVQFLHTLFDQVWLRFCNKCAVEFYDDDLDKSELSYQSLHDQAELVQHKLKKYILEPSGPNAVGNATSAKLADNKSQKFIECSGHTTLIGLYMPVNVILPSLIIGILRSGFGFVPISPSSPHTANLEFIERVGIEYIITSNDLLCKKLNLTLSGKISDGKSKDLFSHGSHKAVLCRINYAEKSFKSSTCRTNIAYTLCTSGTTGTPKVVHVPHECILPNILHLKQIYDINADDKVALCSPLTFDPSIVEMFVALCSGATLVLVSEEIKRNPTRLMQVFFNKSRVTIMQSTPSLFSRFQTDDLIKTVFAKSSPLRVLALGGEACPSYKSIKSWYGENSRDYTKVKIINLYGITEVSSWATWHRLCSEEIALGNDNFVPLGWPLYDTTIDIIDGDGNKLCCISHCKNNLQNDEDYLQMQYKITFCAKLRLENDILSCQGYLRIGGTSRTCYLDDGKETIITQKQESDEADGLIMRDTGDMVKLRIHRSLLPDENANIKDFVCKSCNSEVQLFYLGRTDRQFKRHGKRMNPARVENKLMELDAVSSAYVMFVQTCGGGSYEFTSMQGKQSFNIVVRKVVAFVSLHHNSITTVEKHIMLFLSKHLDANYIPDEVVVVDQMPVTRHGKVDAGTLLRFFNQMHKPCDKQMSNSKNSLFFFDQQAVIRCWDETLTAAEGTECKTVLDVPSLDKKFLKCGGNSLSAMKLVSLLQKEVQFGSKLDVSELLQKILNETLHDLLKYVKHKAATNGQKRTAEDCDKKSLVNDTKQTLNKRQHVWETEFEASNEKPSGIVDSARNNETPCTSLVSFRRGGVMVYHNSIRGLPITKNLAADRKILDDVVTQTSKITLKETWHYNTHKCVDASPLVVLPAQKMNTGFVVIGSHSHLLSCIDLNSGTPKWEVELGDRIEASACLTACGDYVVVGCYDKCVYCLDAYNGSVVWKFFTGGEVKSSACPRPGSSVIYIGSHDGFVYCLSAKLREVIWKQHCGGGAIFSSPCLHVLTNKESSLCLYACSLAGGVLSLNGDSGTLRWSIKLPKPVFSSPAVCQFGVCIGCVDGCMYMVSHHNGTIIWKIKTEKPIFSSPALCSYQGKQMILFGSHDGALYCVDAMKGDLCWKHSSIAGSPIYATPCPFSFVVHQESEDIVEEIYLLASASTDGIISILNLQDGCLLGKHRIDGHVFSSPVVIKQTFEARNALHDSSHTTCYDLLVGCRDDNLYSVRLSA